MKTQETYFNGIKLAGIPMIFFNIFLLAISIYLFTFIAKANFGLILVPVLLFAFQSIAWMGFIKNEPNEAKVMVFFGKYSGTIKENGFFWVNPLYSKQKLTLRARNLDADPIKVNDKSGNPILIGQVIVWRIVDTYKASFDIDNTSMATTPMAAGATELNNKMNAYEQFVKVQSDAALRFVAGLYAYDNSINDSEEITLRAGGEEINEILEKQLNERLALAGIEVLEARISFLAYAPEIAAVMLRRQQADAVIAAREKIVEGAVSMVKQALEQLSEQEVVELDDDKKAAMVSNLLVVLCSDEPAQPVINSGTLYN